uniref:FA complementation group F n=1 Tax=Salvator merianae TaxID=96440 RepID=A0A8D0B722_SALMN
METVLSQAEHLPSLLAASRSTSVQSWDTETLSRALNWARYFQQLHGRLCTKPSLRTALIRRLRRGGPLGFGHLKRCPELLGLALLENQALPSAARQRLLRALLFPAAAEREESFPPLLARRKAASQLLSLAPPTTTPPVLSPSLQTQGQLLLARLREQSTAEDTACEDGSFFPATALLQQLPPGPTLYKAAAAALLEPPSDEEEGAARATLLSWLLQGNPARLADFCRLLPASWIASLYSRYPELRAPYLNLLSAWGCQFRFEPLCGEWKVHGQEGDGVTWQEMRERVSCLLSHAPEPLARAVETHLWDWRAQDGDFEVRGLSVWTDLLLAGSGHGPSSPAFCFT